MYRVEHTTQKDGSDAGVAAKQLEAYFLRQFLSSMPEGGLIGGEGVAGSTFRGMFEEMLADVLAQSGDIGLAKTLEAKLGHVEPPAPGSLEGATQSLSPSSELNIETWNDYADVVASHQIGANDVSTGVPTKGEE